MPTKTFPNELRHAKDALTAAMQQLQMAFVRDNGHRIGGVDPAVYEETVRRVAQECGINIMCALKPNGSIGNFETIMTDAINDTMTLSHGGAVCPCCGEPWHS